MGNSLDDREEDNVSPCSSNGQVSRTNLVQTKLNEINSANYVDNVSLCNSNGQVSRTNLVKQTKLNENNFADDVDNVSPCSFNDQVSRTNLVKHMKLNEINSADNVSKPIPYKDGKSWPSLSQLPAIQTVTTYLIETCHNYRQTMKAVLSSRLAEKNSEEDGCCKGDTNSQTNHTSTSSHLQEVDVMISGRLAARNNEEDGCCKGDIDMVSLVDVSQTNHTSTSSHLQEVDVIISGGLAVRDSEEDGCCKGDIDMVSLAVNSQTNHTSTSSHSQEVDSEDKDIKQNYRDGGKVDVGIGDCTLTISRKRGRPPMSGHSNSDYKRFKMSDKVNLIKDTFYKGNLKHVCRGRGANTVSAKK